MSKAKIPHGSVDPSPSIAASLPTVAVNGSIQEVTPHFYRQPPPASAILKDFDLDAFRASEGPMATPVDAGVDAVRVEKPRKLEFVFIHAEWRDYLFIIQGDFKSRREAYLVLPRVAVAFPNICRKVLVVPYCTSMGNYYLLAGTCKKTPWDASTTTTSPPCVKSARRPPAGGASSKPTWRTRPTTCTKPSMRGMHRAGRWKGLPFLIKKAFEDRIIAAGDQLPILAQLRGRRV